jgi:hypothetical protein
LAANLSAFVGFNDIAAKEFFVVQRTGVGKQGSSTVGQSVRSVSWSVFACSFCSVFSCVAPRKRRSPLPFIVQCDVFSHYFLTNPLRGREDGGNKAKKGSQVPANTSGPKINRFHPECVHTARYVTSIADSKSFTTATTNPHQHA